MSNYKKFILLTSITLLIVILDTFIFKDYYIIFSSINVILLLIHSLITYFYFIKHKQKELNLPSYYDLFLVGSVYMLISQVLNIIGHLFGPQLELSMKFIEMALIIVACMIINRLVKIARDHNHKMTW